MPVLPNMLLGVLIGYYLGFAKVDSVFWAYLFVDPSKLLSKVPASARSNAVSFYQAQLDSVYNLDYFLLTCCIILISSFIGQMLKYPSQKLYHLGSLITLVGAIVIELLYAAPAALKVAKKAGKIINLLHSVAFYHAAVFGLLVLTAVIQTSIEQEEYEEESKIKAE